MGQNRRFKGRQFTAEIILWTVRWYLMFPVSYRELALMLRDRGAFRSAIELNQAIRAYLDAHNADPKPFRWTAPADTIISAQPTRGMPTDVTPLSIPLRPFTPFGRGQASHVQAGAAPA
ncbi:hypothetical protein [Roseomonas chloroacetimidivorans]|uniref:hypothetical protein n=1 Tax=Roseomonas chloroacetimidivorans TaxID=1766656 RepID=UPI003C72FDCF